MCHCEFDAWVQFIYFFPHFVQILNASTEYLKYVIQKPFHKSERYFAIFNLLLCNCNDILLNLLVHKYIGICWSRLCTNLFQPFVHKDYYQIKKTLYLRTTYCEIY